MRNAKEHQNVLRYYRMSNPTLEDGVFVTAKGNVSHTFYIMFPRKHLFTWLEKATASLFFKLKPGQVVLLELENIKNSHETNRRHQTSAHMYKFRHLACLRFLNQPFRHLKIQSNTRPSPS